MGTSMSHDSVRDRLGGPADDWSERPTEDSATSPGDAAIISSNGENSPRKGVSRGQAASMVLSEDTETGVHSKDCSRLPPSRDKLCVVVLGQLPEGSTPASLGDNEGLAELWRVVEHDRVPRLDPLAEEV